MSVNGPLENSSSGNLFQNELEGGSDITDTDDMTQNTNSNSNSLAANSSEQLDSQNNSMNSCDSPSFALQNALAQVDNLLGCSSILQDKDSGLTTPLHMSPSMSDEHIKLLCEELAHIISNPEFSPLNSAQIQISTAEKLIEWLLLFIPPENHSKLLNVPQSTRTKSSVANNINGAEVTSKPVLSSYTKDNTIPISVSSSAEQNEIQPLQAMHHGHRLDSDHRFYQPSISSTTTNSNPLSDMLSIERGYSDATNYSSATLPANFRHKPRGTNLLVDYIGRDSYRHNAASTEFLKSSNTPGRNGSEIAADYPTEYQREGIPPRPFTMTPEPWVNIDDDTNNFRRSGSLRKLSKALGKLRRGSGSRSNPVLIGSKHSFDTEDPYRREFLSRDPVSLGDWFMLLGLEHYVERVTQKRINSCALLKLVIDGALEKEIKLEHPLHRKKLELALEEILKFGITPLASLDYKWVLNWLTLIGLSNLCKRFELARVDGRMLHMMTMNDLHHLDIESPYLLASLRSAIRALRLSNFSPEYLDSINGDENFILYWSNTRVIQWIISIGLESYLKDPIKISGLHGAVMMLEDSFNSNTLIEILDIPKSKTYLRNHLQTKFMEIIGPQCAQYKMDKSTQKGFTRLSLSLSKSKKKFSRGSSNPSSFKKKLAKEVNRLLCPLVVDPNSNYPCFQGNLSIFQGLIDSYMYSATDLDTPQLTRSNEILNHSTNSSQSASMSKSNKGDILV